MFSILATIIGVLSSGVALLLYYAKKLNDKYVALKALQNTIAAGYEKRIQVLENQLVSFAKSTSNNRTDGDIISSLQRGEF